MSLLALAIRVTASLAKPGLILRSPPKLWRFWHFGGIPSPAKEVKFAQDFAKKANDLHEAAVALEAAGKKADKSGILDAAGKVGNACKACHDEYREK